MSADYYINNKENMCICCGVKVEQGDIVYNTSEGLVHDDCFYDYMRIYAKEQGWKRSVAGGGDI